MVFCDVSHAGGPHSGSQPWVVDQLGQALRELHAIEPWDEEGGLPIADDVGDSTVAEGDHR
jgi:hypothetical protein